MIILLMTAFSPNMDDDNSKFFIQVSLNGQFEDSVFYFQGHERRLLDPKVYYDLAQIDSVKISRDSLDLVCDKSLLKNVYNLGGDSIYFPLEIKFYTRGFKEHAKLKYCVDVINWTYCRE